jgi:hypothetical protein
MNSSDSEFLLGISGGWRGGQKERRLGSRYQSFVAADTNTNWVV